MVTKDSLYIQYTDVSCSRRERTFGLWKQGFSASFAQCKFQEWLWNTEILCCIKKNNNGRMFLYLSFQNPVKHYIQMKKKYCYALENKRFIPKNI